MTRRHRGYRDCERCGLTFEKSPMDTTRLCPRCRKERRERPTQQAEARMRSESEIRRYRSHYALGYEHGKAGKRRISAMPGYVRGHADGSAGRPSVPPL